MLSKRNMRKLKKGMVICIGVLLFGLVGCSTVAQNDTIENTFISVVKAISRQDMEGVKQLYLLSESDEIKIQNNMQHLKYIKDVEVTNIDELYNDGVYSLVMVSSLYDFDQMNDCPCVDGFIVKHLEDGYQFIGEEYAYQLMEDVNLQALLHNMQYYLNQYKQTQTYYDMVNLVNSYTMAHQEEINLLNQQIQETMIQAQNAANQAANQAMQAVDPNFAPLPIQ